MQDREPGREGCPGLPIASRPSLDASLASVRVVFGPIQSKIRIDHLPSARRDPVADVRKMTVPAMLERLLRVAAAPPLGRSKLPPLTRRALGTLPPMTASR